MRRLTDIPAALTCLLAAVCGCGQQPVERPPSPASPRVINGVEALESQLPQFVRVLGFNSADFFSACTGTVIGRRAVLTAAHCVGVRDLVVQTGGPDGSPFSPAAVYLGKDLTGDAHRDIALILLDREIGRPALPLLAGAVPQRGEQIMVVGFGVDHPQRGDFGTLRFGEMTVSDSGAGYLAAFYDGRGSNVCFGDSGGPAIYAAKDAWGNHLGPAVAGVVSYGTDPSCAPGDTTLFAALDGSISRMLELVPDAEIR